MAIAGGLGAHASLRDVPHEEDAAHDAAILFSESPSRFILEVRPEQLNALKRLFGALPLGRLGTVAADPSTPGMPPRLTVRGIDDTPLIDRAIPDLKAAWQGPLRW